jgi:hypothetical protein
MLPVCLVHNVMCPVSVVCVCAVGVATTRHQMDGLDLSIPTELQDALTAFGDSADGVSTTIQATHDTIDDCKPAAPCTVAALNVAPPGQQVHNISFIPFR